MPQASSDEMDQAKFVFQGTVKKTRGTTMKAIPASDRTVIVRVDKLIHAADAFSDYAGREITVQLATNESVKANQTFIFFTNGWVVGEGLAVQSVGHRDATPSAVASLAAHPEDPVRSLKTREAVKRASAADLIVSGRVSSVRLPAHEATARATAMASGRTSEQISEHAPLWQEAVIDIDEVHKGDHSKKQVVVLFPSSTDVRWHNAPKFQAGQEGVFLLHKDQPAVRAAAVLAPTAEATGYTALHEADIQPLDELSHLTAASVESNGKK